MRLQFTNIKGRTEEIIETVMQTTELQNQPALDYTLRLVTEELVANVVNYSTSEDLTIDIEREGNTLRLRFSDHGVPFNPLEYKLPDTTLCAEEREIGGLGILLVKELMDKVSYQYDNEQNILTIEKTL